MKTEDDFFATIRQSLGLPVDIRRTGQEFPDLFSSEFSGPSANGPADELLGVLQESCRRHNLTLHLVDDEAQAAELIVGLVRDADPEFSDKKGVIMHDQPLLISLKLRQRLEEDNVQLHVCKEGDPDSREKHQLSCVGITAPDCVVASHGTIVQQSRKGQPRSTSLLPSRHIAVVRQEQVVRGLADGFSTIKEMAGTNVVLISGPSKTADIEAQLVFGAHGPRHMDLIVIRLESID